MSENKRTADDDRLYMRRSKAIALRVAGKNFREIAKELGVSLAVAHHDVRTILEDVGEEVSEAREEAVKVEIERLDHWLSIVTDVLESQAEPETTLKAVDRAVKISERRSKLLGLDAPTKQEVVGKLDVTEATPAKAREVMSALFGAVTPGARDGA